MSPIAPFTVLSATVVLGSSLEGWSLLDPSNDADRVFRYPVSFDQAFSAPPVVHIGIVGLDAGKDENLRIRVRAVDISRAGFAIEAATWLNSRLWSVEVSWLAIGG